MSELDEQGLNNAYHNHCGYGPVKISRALIRDIVSDYLAAATRVEMRHDPLKITVTHLTGMSSGPLDPDRDPIHVRIAWGGAE